MNEFSSLTATVFHRPIRSRRFFLSVFILHDNVDTFQPIEKSRSLVSGQILKDKILLTLVDFELV